MSFCFWYINGVWLIWDLVKIEYVFCESGKPSSCFTSVYLKLT